MKTNTCGLAAIVVLCACSHSAKAPTCLSGADGFGADGRVSVRADEVVSGLEVPWGLAFLANGDMLITERPGRVRLVRNGQLLSTPVATVAVSSRAESGLLGIALHPMFESNRFFYLYATVDKSSKQVNRVERWQLAVDGLSASFEKVILDDLEAAQFHDGGRIRFGPDGMLYIGVGDAREPDRAQDPNSLNGKLLRVTDEGLVPADNPGSSAVFLSGVRNTQGFDWWDGTTLIVSDHGPSGDTARFGHDEVNIARRGDNLAWPTLYGCEAQAGLVSPVLTWDKAVPPGGLAVYRSDAIPEWKDSILVGTLGSKHLHRVMLNPEATQVSAHEVYFRDVLGRLREVIVSPDGQLYLTTSNCDGRGDCPATKDRVLRVVRTE